MQLGVLKGKLARKILAFFILASFLPLLITSLIAYQQINNIIQADTLHNLRATSKEYGLSLFFRLKLAKDTLNNNAASLLSGSSNDKAKKNLFNYFSAIAKRTPETTIDIFWGDIDPQLIKQVDLHKQSLFTYYRTESKQDVYIILSNGIIGKIDSKYLWDIDKQHNANEFCVINSQYEKVFCQTKLNRKQLLTIKNTSSNKDNRKTIIPVEGEDKLFSYWSLFLDHEFGINNWIIITGQNSHLEKGTLTRFKSLFFSLLIFSLLLVVLLSSILIRKNLDAINKLIEGTRNIISGNFKHTIDIPSNDELSELAASFNLMANNMEGIVNEYQAFSDIDHLILKSVDKDNIIKSIFSSLTTIIQLDQAVLIKKINDTKGLGYYPYKNAHRKSNTIGAEAIKRIYTAIKTLKLDKTTVITSDEYNKQLDLAAVVNTEKTSCIVPILIDSERDHISYIILALNKPSISELEKKKLDVFANRIAIAFQAMAREADLRHKANHDPLTLLPNKNNILSFYNNQQVAKTEKSTTSALLFLDLDHFKQVNDNYGHLVGDKLLKEFATRVKKLLSESDILARIGGDEFVIISSSSTTGNLNNKLNKLCKRIINSAVESFHIDNHVLYIGASIGIAIGDDYSESFEDAIRHADIAMYYSKQQGGNNHTIYNKTMSDDLLKRNLLETDLRAAIENNEIDVHFQPKFSSSSKQLMGFEALFRWQHITYGPISPFIAIEIAEDIGIIADLGKLIFQKSLKQVQSWLEQGYDIGTIAINVSPAQLIQTDFIDFVETSIRQTALVEPYMVELEITENVMLQDKELSISILKKLKGIGVSIAIDDFGTGYSSLSYLLELPADTLKIDRLFVIKIEQDENALALLSSLINLGKSMGYKIVAEGVETQQQADFLTSCQADELQGYLFSKPLAAELIEKRFLKNQTVAIKDRESLN